MRIIWLIGGWSALGAGVIGAVLPLLPTVPFLLLAAFCFARSSQRIHDWLLSHPRFGPPIEDWRRNGSIRPRMKLFAMLSICATFGISLALGVKPHVLIIQAIALAGVTAFILSRPDGPRD